MASKAQKQAWIVTTPGMDAACSAALLLMHEPEATLVITSKNRLAQSLDTLRESSAKGSTVHICGVGIGDRPEVTLDALAKLCLTGAEVVWYCGREYLNEYQKEIAKRCTIEFTSCASNTEAVYKAYRFGKNKRAPLLLQLAGEFCANTAAFSKDTAWWHDYVDASVARSFEFGDEAAYPSCIRKLADIEPVTPADRAAANKQKEYRAYALPVGNSPAMKNLRAMITRLGPIDEPVLILGPSGAGKESVARLLHKGSRRSESLFVAVNCATLATSKDLAHDRLFGHTIGAYTGATTATRGAFLEADGGTLFLDEVGELPLEAQAQLLRVLEERKVIPLGTMEPQPVNVRVVAATNRNLAGMVAEGTFRLDLFYRLNVLSLIVPALKDRVDDMKSVANALQHDLKTNGHPLKLTQDDWNAIRSYDWPGNIRQFKNVLKRAAYMKITVCEALSIELSCFPASGEAGSANAPDLGLLMPQTEDSIMPVDEVRMAYMRHCLKLCDGNWTRAANKLGVVTNTLRKWLDAPRRG